MVKIDELMKQYREMLQNETTEDVIIPEQKYVTPQEAAAILNINPKEDLKKQIDREFPRHPEIWWIEKEMDVITYIMNGR